MADHRNGSVVGEERLTHSALRSFGYRALTTAKSGMSPVPVGCNDWQESENGPSIGTVNEPAK
ncbi:hypothetical protein TRP8649_04657 [Pelagimonas phthalicica]|uniref:Uncharacterized protein n=1 Tax=Pelagimonas phthalicica TaxID=1037362 RepID=A0A238JJD0_9RHOB|nr:hypothetical protein CLV87_4661 [Pelagimonas phthalicica]SMX30513.1 hypothetical protein TRP8649_04657 [Pelagimonas phthalicica]